jgi:hypothetical protein
MPVLPPDQRGAAALRTCILNYTDAVTRRRTGDQNRTKQVLGRLHDLLTAQQRNSEYRDFPKNRGT